MRASRISVALAVVLALAAQLGTVAACAPAKPADTAHADDVTVAKDSDTPPGVAPTPPAPAFAPPPAANPSGVPYDKEAVETELKRAARQIKANCGATTDEDGKATGPWGKTTVSVKLGHNGHSQGATISAPYDGRPVGKCVFQAFAVLTYPPFAGADTALDWDIELVQPAAPPAPATPARRH